MCVRVKRRMMSHACVCTTDAEAPCRNVQEKARERETKEVGKEEEKKGRIGAGKTEEEAEVARKVETVVYAETKVRYKRLLAETRKRETGGRGLEERE